ncbi:hypothetical protein Btru_013316 [Bulinus truncatus]|nr:hypothetical protein Btru_013316 [Bulinus truncatus]
MLVYVQESANRPQLKDVTKKVKIRRILSKITYSILRGMIFTLGRDEDGSYSSDFTASKLVLTTIDYYYGSYEYCRSDLVAANDQNLRSWDEWV